MSEKEEESKLVEVADTITLSGGIDVIFVRSPLRFLKDEISEKRFLEGIVVAVMYFERFGIERLKEYFKAIYCL